MRLLAGTAAVAALLLLLAAPAPARTGQVELGTAVGGPDFMANPDPRYRETMKLFDAITAENDMKMYYQRPSRAVFDFTVGDALVAFAAANGQQVHGHTLIWCNDSSTPGWVRNGSWTRATLLAVMREHITAVLNHYRGRVATWDVVNEALADDGSLRNCVWSRVIGADWVEQAFRIADSVDPQVRLFYNEVRADVPNPKYEALLAMARDFKARGVPLDGVGLQYHLSENQPTQAQMEEGIRRLGELGLDVHISELDVPIWYLGPSTIPERLALQPEIYRRVANACQAQPACFRITTWGFTDRVTYRCCNAKPLPFDEEYQPKGAWAVLQEVLRPAGPTRPPPLPPPPPAAPQPVAQATAAARGPLVAGGAHQAPAPAHSPAPPRAGREAAPRRHRHRQRPAGRTAARPRPRAHGREHPGRERPDCRDPARLRGAPAPAPRAVRAPACWRRSPRTQRAATPRRPPQRLADSPLARAPRCVRRRSPAPAICR